MIRPKISVVIPVYNVKDFLTECVESVLVQTFENFEILLIDDGSTDGSKKLIDELIKKDERIRVFHKENGGLSSARNVGIRKSEGEFLAFVDSDDSVKPSFLKELYESIKEDNSDVSVCGYGLEIPEKRTLSGKEACIKLLTEQKNLDILAWNKLYKKSLFLENNIFYPEGKLHEDNLTTYKLYSKAKKVSFIPKSLYNYRKRPGSITEANKKELHLEMRELAAREAIAHLESDNDLKQAAEISLLLAKFAWLDNALSDRVDKKYIEESLSWLKTHKKDFSKNKFLSRKLKCYLELSTNLNGIGYKLFRKVKRPYPSSISV